MVSQLDGYPSKFLYLLLSLIFYFFSTSFLSRGHYTSILLSIIFTLIILCCVLVMSRNKFLTTIALIAGLITLISHWSININPLYHNDSLYMCFYISHLFFLLCIIYSVLHSVLQDKKITPDTIFGAICGYLLIGFTWAYMYLLIALHDPAAFTQKLIALSIHESARHAFYYSFTTLTTLGYGDILPVTDQARTLSWVEAVVGQIYLVVWISQLVGVRIMQKAED